TLPDELVDLLGQRRDRLGLLAVDAHDLRRWRSVRPDVVTPSLVEAERLVGATTGMSRVGWASEHLEQTREAAGARIAAVTLDVDGTVVADDAGQRYRIATEPRSTPTSSGAGDSYLAGFVLALLAGARAGQAAEVAQAAAAAAGEPGGGPGRGARRALLRRRGGGLRRGQPGGAAETGAPGRLRQGR